MLIIMEPNDLNAKEYSTIRKRLGKDSFNEIASGMPWYVNGCLWQYLIDCDVVLMVPR
jgi:hypothetical protein